MWAHTACVEESKAGTKCTSLVLYPHGLTGQFKVTVCGDTLMNFSME